MPKKIVRGITKSLDGTKKTLIKNQIVRSKKGGRYESGDLYQSFNQ